MPIQPTNVHPMPVKHQTACMEQKQDRIREISCDDVLFGLAIAGIVLLACTIFSGFGVALAGMILADAALTEIGFAISAGTIYAAGHLGLGILSRM